LDEFAPKSNDILAKLGVPLIFVDDWSDPSKYQSSGFAEESADKLFAALVNFNQAYSGELLNALFNSPFHFIGHGRGAVVNSEVIQRLGTFFPRDKFATMFPDLQMTTIDPTDFEQNGKNYFDPSIQVWQNVTFADNYYQTTSQTFNHGRELVNTIPPEWSELKGFTNSRADLNVQLDNRVGFAQDSSSAVDNPHNRAFAWYAGTADLSLDGLDSAFGTPIFRRKGDFSQTAFKDGPLTPWYTNDLTPIFPGLPFRSRVDLGDANGQWEGMGTGWYYSAIGGGRDRRSQIAPKQNRVQVGFDNSNQSKQRGDFAVPTLFNGNFDVSSTWRKPTDPIPGWVFENNPNLGQNRLKTWANILPNGSPDRTTYSTTLSSNYAIELHNGDSLVHNPFIITDWGSLRFNILAPNLGNGTLNVQLQESGSNNWVTLDATQIRRSEDPLIDDGSGTLIPNPARPNNVGYYDFNNGVYEDPYTHTISYGERGFETFVLDIPEYLRGKSVVLKFTSTSTSTIYLDDVFFKSQHLLLGNPSDARPDETANRNNYLIEKPQYSLSYNDATKTPNWVSWQLNKSWISDPGVKRPGVSEAVKVGYTNSGYPPANDYIVNATDYPWLADGELPDNWVKTIGSDYRSNDRGMEKGHMTPVADRNRTLKDVYATFFTSNMLPQHTDNNQGAWQNFERDIQTSIKNSSTLRDYYIISGGYGYDPNRIIGNRISTRSDGRIVVDNSGTWTINPKNISIPEFTWKIIVPLEAGQTISDITANTQAIAIMVPNRAELVTPRNFPLPGETSRQITNWSRWQDWRVSINYLESLTNYNFLSELPDSIQEAIESRSNGLLPSSASLLADENFALNSILDYVGNNLSIGQKGLSQITTAKFIDIDSSISEITSCERYFTEFGTTEINVTETGIIHSRLSQDGILKVSSFQTGSSQSSSLQYTLAQISPTQIDILKDSISHTSTSEVSFPQINTKQSSIGQVGSGKNDSSQASVLKFNPSQIQPTEVSISSSITSQQLFSSNLSHNSSPNLLTDIYNTAQTLWHTTTPIDLAFKIQDLLEPPRRHHNQQHT
jgi:DNA/RNA endonuclease G (NUC1)